ncbi:MAG: hypothetical protein WDM87_17255 [Terracidiphilus sp.]
MKDNETRVRTSSVISDVNKVAMDYARNHAGELLGKKWYDGESGTGPSEKWVVSESTKRIVREIITDAFSRETPINVLAERIHEAAGFSKEQARLVAETEVKLSQSRGNLEAWKRMGTVKSIKWLVSTLHTVRDECDLNAEAGAIPLGQIFPSGAPAPPAHIGCRCSVSIAELYEPKKRHPPS